MSKTIIQENNRTTTVLMAVATSESVFLIPHFAIRVQRLMENRGYTREKSISIIASQAPESFFRENADYVVVNNGDFAQTRQQIEEGIEKI